jgi:hypothetical protein
VTRDEIQKLIGGYATGSLTDAERKLLFDAALEDQELFDELAHEQVLKELLEQPGAKQRLLAALEPETSNRIFVRKQWPWAVAAAAACMAVVIGVVVLRTAEKPREIAVVTAPADVAKPTEPPAPAVATPEPAPATPPPVARPVLPKARPAAAPIVENAPAPPPAAPLPAELPKAEKAAQPAVDAIQQVAVPAAPAPAPPQPINGFRADQTPQVQAGQLQVGGAPAGFAGKAGGKGGGGGGAGGGRGPAPQFAASRAVATRFAFDYSFDASGALRIVPAAQGYLSVSVAPASPGSVLLPSRNVAPGTPVIVSIPADAPELVVSFSATPAAVTGTPVRREESAGTVEDQNQRILITIPVKR